VQAIARAYSQAEYEATTVELIEAHGTSTKVGDATELGTLSLLWDGSPAGDHVAVGSIKSQIGHLKAAAGIAGIMKSVMALHHRTIPPSAGFETPNPTVEWSEIPFFVPTEAREWPQPDGHPRRAGISAFGFGGTNFHVALEGYEPSYHQPLAPLGINVGTPTLVGELTSKNSPSAPSITMHQCAKHDSRGTEGHRRWHFVALLLYIGGLKATLQSVNLQGAISMKTQRACVCLPIVLHPLNLTPQMPVRMASYRHIMGKNFPSVAPSHSKPWTIKKSGASYKHKVCFSPTMHRCIQEGESRAHVPWSRQSIRWHDA